ncbi:MAG: hypothetical protein R3E96_07260 [Planctomycetota bacterium]
MTHRLLQFAAATLVCAAPAWAQSPVIQANNLDGIELGSAWDDLRDLAGTHVVNFTVTDGTSSLNGGGGHVEQQGSQSVETRMFMIESQQQLQEALGVDASLSYSSGLNSAEGTASFMRQVNEESYDMNFLVIVSVTQSARYAHNPVLTPSAIELLKKNPNQFHTANGNGFISAVETGGKYYGMVTVHASSRSEQQDIKASFSGSTMTVSGSASIAASFSEVSKTKMITVSEFRVGGPPMNATVEISGENAVSIMVGHAQAFPLEVAQAPVITQFSWTSFERLNDYQANIPNGFVWSQDAQTDKFRQVLAAMNDYNNAVEHYQFAIDNHDAFYSVDDRQMVAYRDEAQKRLDDLKNRLMDFRLSPTKTISLPNGFVSAADYMKSTPYPRRYKGFVRGMTLDVVPPDFGRMEISQHTNGDGEYNGHDVDLSAIVSIQVGADRRTLYRHIEGVEVREAYRDHTTFKIPPYTEPRPFYTAPEGLIITSVDSANGLLSTRVSSTKSPKTYMGTGSLKSLSCISDTVESYDNIYMSSMSFNPVYVHFAHEEVVEAQSQKNHR